MKDLIAVFTYCPDDERKITLIESVKKLQCLRERFDIIVVSHSDLPNSLSSMVDYTYVEYDNKLIHEFDVTNKFWFNTEEFFISSSLVYPFSTHLSIYSMIHSVLNFSKFKGYSKVHCLEYDINLDDAFLIERTNQKLDEFDNVMFKSKDGWVHGIYVAFKIDKFPDNYFKYDVNFILDEIRNVETRMTEHYTPRFLGVNNRSTFFDDVTNISKEGKLQKIDSHNNDALTWCVPIVNEEEKMLFFVFNEKGGKHQMDVFVNDKHFHLDNANKGSWNLISLGDFNDIQKFTLLVNSKIRHNIVFDSKNRKVFKENNFLRKK